MRHRTNFDPTPRPITRAASSPTVSEAVTNAPVKPNPYVPPIPPLAFDSTGETRNLTAAILALKAAVESLAGQRGDIANRAVTFKDLVDYGLLSAAALRSPNGTGD